MPALPGQADSYSQKSKAQKIAVEKSTPKIVSSRLKWVGNDCQLLEHFVVLLWVIFCEGRAVYFCVETLLYFPNQQTRSDKSNINRHKATEK